MSGPVRTVLVVGATGSIGRLVVADALSHGLRVRALARDVRRAEKLLPGADVVAEVLDRSLLADEAVGRTFELFATAGAPPQDRPGLFATTAPDRPGAFDGVRDQATLPVEVEPAAVRRDLDAMAVGASAPGASG